jgi:cytochrome c553
LGVDFERYGGSEMKRRLAASTVFRLVVLGTATAALVATALVPAGLADRTGTRAAHVKTVRVKARDTRFTLSAKSAPVGKVKFVVTNLGKRQHNFRIGGKKTPILKHGKSASIVVSFRKAGRYLYLSTVKGDALRGLRGTLKLTAPDTPGNAKRGKVVFKANCGSCHTLAEADTYGTLGPNLDRRKLAYAKITKTVTNGKRGSIGTMPSFKGSLTPRQIQDVAAFIYASTH